MKCGIPQVRSRGEISTGSPGSRVPGGGWALSLVTSVLCFVLLRSAVGARYEIISESMAPTLSSTVGDQALVDKTTYRRRAPRPFEIVVLKPVDTKTPIVKRALAVGPGRVALRDGDVFVQPLGAEDFERIQKDPRDAFGSIHPVWSSVGATSTPFTPAPTLGSSGLELPDGQWVRSDRDLFEGSTAVPGRSRAVDFGIRVEPDWDSGIGWIELELRAGDRVDRIRIGSDGGLRATREEDPYAARIEPLDARPAVVTFQRLDGRLCLHDARGALRTFEIDVESPPDLVLPGERSFNGIAVRAGGGSSPRLSRVDLIADVHYPAEERAFPLAEGELFVLGDNPPASEDSRALRGAPFHRRDLLGRVVAVIRDGRLVFVDP